MTAAEQVAPASRAAEPGPALLAEEPTPPPAFDLGPLGGERSPLLLESPLQGPPEQVVVLVDRKPIALDTVLPLILALRAEQPDLPVVWLLKSAAYTDAVQRSYVLWEGMNRTGRIASIGGGGRGLAGRLLDRASQLAWARRFARRRTWLLSHGDFASPPVDLLALGVRRGGGALVGYARWSCPMSRARLMGMLDLQKAAGRRFAHYRAAGDFWLVPHPLHASHLRRLVNTPLVVVGTPRCYPEWQDYLDTIGDAVGLVDEQGAPIDGNGRPVLVVFYPGNHPLPDLVGDNACRDQLFAMLAAITDSVPDAMVVLKPHVICDVAEVQVVRGAFPKLDLRVSHAHPQLLARIARAAIFTNGSNVMDDMYAAGVPVIETALYREWVDREGGSQFPNPGRIDARTPAAMRAALQRVLQDPPAVEPAATGHLVWPRPQRVSDCLWRRRT